MSAPNELAPTRHDLPESVRAAVVALCNARLADAVDLYTQTKQAHWNVRGPNFIALHELFDEIGEDVEEYVDLTAERAVQLGGTALGTARLAAAASTLAEYPRAARTGREHVEAMADALATYGRSVRSAIDAADRLGDKDAADLFTEISRGVDRWLWAVEAHVRANA
ncbi:MAG: DNA starvation/stationary phase protection protein Dps [Planctomycetes bacterium]|nr:DNA starvation/stationary phase protection protein Dps [Planctomycetota bacterium]